MNVAKLNKFYSILIVIISTFIPTCLSAQTTSDNFSVKYLGQYGNGNLNKASSIMDRLANLVFGNEKVSVNKPMSVCKSGRNLLILDQDTGTLLKLLTDELKLIKIDYQYQFPSLVSITPFIKHEFLFTDSSLNTIFLYDDSLQTVKKFQLNKIVNQPTGIVYNPLSSTVWIAETASHKISEFDCKGNFIRSIGTRGTDNNMFNYPTYLSVDYSGDIYVVDALNFRIQIFSSNGEFLASFGKQGDASGYMASPKGISIDSYGHIFLVDALFNSVQVFDRNGNFLYYFGKKGKLKKEFLLPTGIFIDPENNIYIADSYNSRIQLFKLSKEE